ncbi:GntR family transcriptional regulator [Metabacillus litoralis]|jgi:GntR family transcriptional regulator of gluconate operon|uniref:GntR family transcriptional regulator n=1 Tax=Metabacillus litoralis TaxID=152268 RepID=UPI00203DE2B5|nr:GntR family transcriptional regulator [Metabacillus litoralis]MCM3652864.1 GntR family transcriptional regulator [Metabacillus litoralis]
MQFPAIALQGESLGEKISCELRLQIINGSIESGAVLSENQIAAEFNTSRSPVREALKTLSNEGLIRQERMGAVVLGLSAKDIEELYDVRSLIETFTIQRLSEMDHEHVIHSLKKIIDKMEFAAKHNDYVEFTMQDLAFHVVMIEEAKHTRILHLWKSIRYIIFTALLIATERRFKENKNEIEPLIKKHQLLINAISSKDDDYIEKTVKDHFDDTRKTVNNTLQKSI